MGERPTRMWRAGRAGDPVFAATEKLFRRYKREHVPNGQWSNLNLPFRSPLSVNRQKYSDPSDVIFSESGEFAGWGVFSVEVQHVPRFYPPDRPEYGFSVFHAPLEDNYAHTNIVCDAVPPTGKHVEPRPQIRKLVRTLLSQRIIREIEALV